MGIEPTFSAWKAGVLPIYDTRLLWSERRDSNPQHPPWQGGALPIEPLPHILFLMERVVGIEPTFSAWKAGVLPIYDTRLNGADEGSRTPTPKALDPKSSASANSATSAFIYLVAYRGIEPRTP